MESQLVYAEAARRYRKAAERGDADAQALLGLLYELGRGLQQDFVEAHKWLDLAASRVQADKQKDLVRDRNRLAAKMTPQQIAEAQRLAQGWKPVTERQK
jgi:uncharacterized protein